MAGQVGLVVVGMGGVGSSLLAGTLLSRSNLVHPFGSLAEGGGAARTQGMPSLREQAPLANLSDLVLGAFELREDDGWRAAVRAGLLNRSLVDEVRPELRKVRAMLGARHAPTRRHLADMLAEDLRGFLAHHHCQRGVVVCTLPGPKAVQGRPAFTPAELWGALEEGADWVTPGVIYAAAAAMAGCSFVAAGRDAALGAPGIAGLFSELGVPMAGTGLIGPDAALREALASALAAEGFSVSGSASLSTRAEERGAGLWGGPDRTQEMAAAHGFAGTSVELSIELRGQVAVYQAARALDAALLLELAHRAGRTGAQEFMDALFTAPLGAASPRHAQQLTLAERRARLWAELPALAQSAAREAA